MEFGIKGASDSGALDFAFAVGWWIGWTGCEQGMRATTQVRRAAPVATTPAGVSVPTLAPRALRTIGARA